MEVFFLGYQLQKQNKLSKMHYLFRKTISILTTASYLIYLEKVNIVVHRYISLKSNSK